MTIDPILIDLPENLVGARVIVRPWHSGEGATLFEALEESRKHLLPWMPWIFSHQTADDSERFVRLSQANWIKREDLSMAIWHRAEGTFLGGTGLHRIDWRARSFEIGYWIRKRFEGQGFVTETVQLLLAMAFTSLNANRVFIRCAVENARSVAVPERLCMRFEGIRYGDILDADGNLRDARTYSMTKGQYRERQTGDMGP